MKHLIDKMNNLIQTGKIKVEDVRIVQHAKQDIVTHGFISSQPNIGSTITIKCTSDFTPETFDYALPQDWVNKMTERGFDPRGHFVTLYPKVGPAYMDPITEEGVRMAAIIASNL